MGKAHYKGKDLTGVRSLQRKLTPDDVGSGKREPTSLRGIANKAKVVCLARKRVQPRNRMRENFTSGTVRGVPGNRHSYRGAHDQTYYSPLVMINFYALTNPKKTRILHVYRTEDFNAEKINNNCG